MLLNGYITEIVRKINVVNGQRPFNHMLINGYQSYSKSFTNASRNLNNLNPFQTLSSSEIREAPHLQCFPVADDENAQGK